MENPNGGFGINSPTPHISSVDVRGDCVVKWVPQETCALEVARFKAARQVSHAWGGFHIPKVLGWDEGIGRIVLERIREIIALRDALGRGRNDADILFQAGRALGLLHDHMYLREIGQNLDFVKTSGPEDTYLPVILHGDYSTVNVCWSDDADSVVVLDWGPVMSDGVKTYGSRYYDLGFFVASLVRVWPWWHSLRMFYSRTDAFLRGYSDVSQPVDLNRLRSYVLRFTRGNAKRLSSRSLRRPTPAVVAKAALHLACHACVALLTECWNRQIKGL